MSRLRGDKIVFVALRRRALAIKLRRGRYRFLLKSVGLREEQPLRGSRRARAPDWSGLAGHCTATRCFCDSFFHALSFSFSFSLSLLLPLSLGDTSRGFSWTLTLSPSLSLSLSLSSSFFFTFSLSFSLSSFSLSGRPLVVFPWTIPFARSSSQERKFLRALYARLLSLSLSLSFLLSFSVSRNLDVKCVDT